MLVMIKDLKKNDKFQFNNKIYTVTKKYRNDDSPLKAICNKPHKHPSLNLPWQDGPELFHHDELEVEKVYDSCEKIRKGVKIARKIYKEHNLLD